MVIKKIFVEEEYINYPVVRSFSETLDLIPNPLENLQQLYEQIKYSIDPCGRGKEILLLTWNKGSFIKKCPGTKDYICCGYHILHIGSFCTMDCSYCILQSYFHPPVLTYFINQNDMLNEIDDLLSKSTTIRIGTGEFTDSLIWEDFSDSTLALMQRFAMQRHSVLELKTKTTAIAAFKHVRHNRKTIISWSLNTPHVITSQERGTSSLRARIRAATQCQSWGYPLAFHFDPIVVYPGCEFDYEEVVEILFQSISADNIVWISLGSLRFIPSLQHIIKKRFPDSNIIYNEFITGTDAKMRYFKALRIRIYRHIFEKIKSYSSSTTVYLCMEDKQVWGNSFGYTPEDSAELSQLLDRSARSICDLE